MLLNLIRNFIVGYFYATPTTVDQTGRQAFYCQAVLQTFFNLSLLQEAISQYNRV